MNRFKILATIFCLSLAAMAFSPSVKADQWNKETVVTFSQPVELPGGVVLPAGTYVFKLMDSASNRHIVQVLNSDKTRTYATILAIPNYRLRATDKTVMTFGERAGDSPEAIRAWFYPGANWGEEFVYPKRRAVELAKSANLPILAMPTELEAQITAPAKSVTDQTVVALKEAPLTAVTPTGEEVGIAQVVTPPPVETTPTQDIATAAPPENMERLPQTAGSLPLLGLVGLLSLGAGLALMGISKRKA